MADGDTPDIGSASDKMLEIIDDEDLRRFLVLAPWQYDPDSGKVGVDADGAPITAGASSGEKDEDTSSRAYLQGACWDKFHTTITSRHGDWLLGSLFYI